VCGVRGHELLGTDVARLRPEDTLVARDDGDLRWYRCVRCDSWLPLPRPRQPERETMQPRDDIELPLRGRALRDRVVLRIIAIDRAIHFVFLAALAVAVFLFAANELRLRRVFYRVVEAVYGTSGGPGRSHHGVLGSLEHLFALSSTKLYVVAAAAAAYAALEGVEAVGLWFQKRWAEYLTFIATLAFIPLEISELVRHLSPFKIGALVVNIAVALYLLLAKRLFGVRGGAAVDERERERDNGWQALERTAPPAPG